MGTHTDFGAALSSIPPALRAWLAGERTLLIDGRWVPAKSGKTFEVTDPATGDVIAHVDGKSANILLPDVDLTPRRDQGCDRHEGQQRPYGLAAYVQGADKERARAVAARMRAGNVFMNYPAWDSGAPFGGYKQSGNGREYGKWAMEDFTEIKATIGYDAA